MPVIDYPIIHASKSTVNRVLQQIKDGLDSEVNRATAFDTDSYNELLKFHSTELKLGRVLGRGGFCVVHELESIQLLLGDNDDDISEISKTSSLANLAGMRRRYLNKSRPKVFTLPADDVENQSRRTLSQAIGKSRIPKYCVKKVDPKLFDKDPATFLKGTIDIALEAKFLSSLQHPNIISIKAVSATGPDQELDYFIIMDRLFELLPKRLNTWMQQYRATQGMTGFITRGRKRANKLLIERLMVALDISNAMCYIHSRGIVFRDLKPDNIGFDKAGTLKIFDFGLAKELDEDRKTDNGLYQMTGFTGGIRYMAPEVGLCKPYNNAVDVYSWSMVFWYILALEPPFGLFTNNMFLDRVFRKHYRPAAYQRWPQSLRELLKISWSRKIKERPSFDEISKVLRGEISKLDPIVSKSLEENISLYDSTTDVTTIDC